MKYHEMVFAVTVPKLSPNYKQIHVHVNSTISDETEVMVIFPDTEQVHNSKILRVMIRSDDVYKLDSLKHWLFCFVWFLVSNVFTLSHIRYLMVSVCSIPPSLLPLCQFC